MLVALCGFATFSLQGNTNTYIFNVVTVIPGAAFTLKCFMQNKDRTLLTVGLIATYWIFCLLAVSNEYLLGIQEYYMSIRLLLLGAIGAKGYYRAVKKLPFSRASSPCKSEVISEYYFEVHPSCVESVKEESQASGALSPTLLGQQAMDPRVRASLERLRAKVDTALRAASIQPTKSSLTGATDNVRTSVARFTSSGRSHPKTYRSQLRTAVISEEGEDDGTQAAGSIYETAACVTDLPPTAVQPSHRCVSKSSQSRELIKELSEDYSIGDARSRKATVAYGDIITNPMSVMRFSPKETMKKLCVINLATEVIMWTLRTDLRGSFDAAPAHGLLRTCEQQVIVICLAAGSAPKKGKIAIDYAFVHPFQPTFDRAIYNAAEKRRHILRVISIE